MSITAEDVLNITTQIVKEKGDDFHPAVMPDGSRKSLNYSNQYFETDRTTPRCIVGHVLAHFGKTEDDLSSKNNFSYGDGSLLVSDANSLKFQDVIVRDFDITKDAAALLETGQESQDEGSYWGEALERMQEHYEDMQEDAL